MVWGDDTSRGRGCREDERKGGNNAEHDETLCLASGDETIKSKRV